MRKKGVTTTYAHDIDTEIDRGIHECTRAPAQIAERKTVGIVRTFLHAAGGRAPGAVSEQWNGPSRGPPAFS